MCSICQCDVDENSYMTPCGHIFHTGCIHECAWYYEGCDIEGEECDLQCPNCRQIFEFIVDEIKAKQTYISR